MSSQSAQKTVLFVRLSAIGDIVMASGLPSNIKAGISNAKVIWMVESPYAQLVASHPDVDGVIPWPKSQWSKLKKEGKWYTLWREIRAFKQLLRSYNFSYAIEAQGLLKSAFFVWLSRAPKKIGFWSKEKSHWLLNEVYKKPTSDQISSEYRYLGEKLGAQSYKMQLGFDDKSVKEANDLLQNAKINEHFLIAAPFTTRPQKHWPQEHWRNLLVELNSQRVHVFIVGAPNDKDKATSLAQHLPFIHNAAGKLSLLGSMALINKAKALIGVDTGMTHVGIACNIPTIALFGSTRPYTKTENKNAHVLFEDMHCAPCKRHPTCNGRFDCLENLSVQRVLNTLKGYM